MSVGRQHCILVVAVIVGLATPFAGVATASSAPGGSVAHSPAEATAPDQSLTGNLTDDDPLPGENETDDATDAIANATEGGTEVVNESIDRTSTEVGSTTGNTTESTGETLDEQVGTANSTADLTTTLANDSLSATSPSSAGDLDTVFTDTGTLDGDTVNLTTSILTETEIVTDLLDSTEMGQLLDEQSDELSMLEDWSTTEEDAFERPEPPEGPSQEDDLPDSDGKTDGTPESPSPAGDDRGSAPSEGDDATSTDGGLVDAALGAVPGPVPSSGAGAGLAVGGVAVGTLFAARKFEVAATVTRPGGGSSLLSTLAALVRTWVRRLLAILGYKRYSDDDPLEHEAREQLYNAICDSPGASLSEISDDAGVPLQTARYHLRILDFENLVNHESIRGRRRYYPINAQWAELEAALNDDSTASIIETLAADGPTSVSSLADALDRDPSTISHHLDRLADDELVEREREGRAVLNKLTPRAAQALQEDEATASAAPPASGQAD